jgi:hypothetical protein
VTALLWGNSENGFRGCFGQRRHRLTKFIASQAEYFEGDCSH